MERPTGLSTAGRTSPRSRAGAVARTVAGDRVTACPANPSATGRTPARRRIGAATRRTTLPDATSRRVQQAPQPPPVECGAGVGLAPRRDVAVPDDPVRGDRGPALNEGAAYAAETFVLARIVEDAVRALQLDADGEVVAAGAALEAGLARVPGPARKTGRTGPANRRAGPGDGRIPADRRPCGSTRAHPDRAGCRKAARCTALRIPRAAG